MIIMIQDIKDLGEHRLLHPKAVFNVGGVRHEVAISTIRPFTTTFKLNFFELLKGV